MYALNKITNTGQITVYGC